VGSTATETALAPTGPDDFCRRQYGRLVGMLGLYCGDRDTAEDLAQEALARLCRHWDELPTERDAERWLTRVAFNLAKSSLRTRLTRRRVVEQHGRELTRDGGSADPANAVAVRAAVAGLPERERRVLILRYFADLPVAQTAVLMRCPEGTVKTLTRQAIERLRTAGLEVADD
jgi:RNA polymerase sigma factor (sigma-70 family)